MAEGFTPREPLAPDRVDLWFIDPAAVPSAWVDRHLDILDPHEREHAESLSLIRARQEYLATRIMLRQVLSAYAGVPPSEWRFAIEPGGRPRISEPAAQARFSFSLSHTPGLTALAVARDVRVGVDVEALGNALDIEAVAGRFFAPAELAAILEVRGEHRKRRFLHHWTLKEACLKALGTGLSASPDMISIRTGADRSYAIIPGPELAGRLGHWQVETATPTEAHILGLALLTHVRRRFEVRARWLHP